MRQESIEVDLSCEAALALVAASFEGAKTAPTLEPLLPHQRQSDRGPFRRG